MPRLSKRETDQDRNITCAEMQLRADTIDEETRSVEATLATEGRVVVFDFQRFETIEEILRMDGVEFGESVPLLDSHKRFSLDNVFGSVRNLRPEGSKLVCRLYFAEIDQDDDEGRRIDRSWKKVKQGHLRNVSVGYRVHEGEIVEPGQTRVINGKRYTAGSRALRVATKWQVREGSLVPIGADPDATTRKAPIAEERKVNENLRQYLESLGMRSDCTEAESWEYYHKLEGKQRSEAEALLDGETPPDPVDPLARVTAEPLIRVTGTTTPTDESDDTPPVDDPLVAARRAAGEAVVQERRRVSTIRERFGDEEPDLMARAIDEGWTVGQAADELLNRLRGRRSAPVETGHLGIHTRGHNQDCGVATLQTAMVLRAGVELDNPMFNGREARHLDGIPDVLRQGLNDDQRQRAMELAHRYESLSLVDICREACRLDGENPGHSAEDAIRAAVSGSALSAIFTANFSASLLVAYVDSPDTTQGWTSSEDVGDFKSNEKAAMGKFGPLTKHGRGATAQNMDTSDSYESYKLGRYSGKFVVDEMDILDDRFGALDGETPRDIGLAAAQVRPDLVYSLLLANPTLNADSIAVYHASHNNLGTSGTALAAATLETAITGMGKQRIRNRPINVRPRFLVTPHDLGFTAKKLLRSAERSEDGGDGTFNALREVGITPVADDRVGVAGVTDPDTGTAYVGTATNYFLFARPGENGAKTIIVGYRRGTGRAPKIVRFMLGEGQWGVGWAIKHDIASKYLDFRGTYKATGAA